jgi:hypothetical protein
MHFVLLGSMLCPAQLVSKAKTRRASLVHDEERHVADGQDPALVAWAEEAARALGVCADQMKGVLMNTSVSGSGSRGYWAVAAMLGSGLQC